MFYLGIRRLNNSEQPHNEAFAEQNKHLHYFLFPFTFSRSLPFVYTINTLARAHKHKHKYLILLTADVLSIHLVFLLCYMQNVSH